MIHVWQCPDCRFYTESRDDAIRHAVQARHEDPVLRSRFEKESGRERSKLKEALERALAPRMLIAKVLSEEFYPDWGVSGTGEFPAIQIIAALETAGFKIIRKRGR